MTERSESERDAARIERERRREGRAGAGDSGGGTSPADERIEPATVEPERRDEAGAASTPRNLGPANLKRLGAPRPTAPDLAPGPQPGAPGMPRHPLSVPPRRRRRSPARVALIFGLLALLLGIGAYVLNGIFTPFKGDGGERVVVTVPAGSSAREVGNLLADKGVVDSGLFFSLRATIGGDRDDLRAGRHVLKRDMSNGAAIEALTTVPAAPPVRDVLIPEGPGRREVARLLEEEGVPGDYLAASKRSSDLDPRSYGAPRGTPSLEGFLFPATYRLRRGAGARTLVSQQLGAFERAIATVPMRRARARNLSVYDVLIIASMVERETALARERPLVAGVIHNRLRERIHLGIDATTRYAEDNWTKPLTNAELERDDPFNTRRNLGLPPTPIGNPGLDSIRAAADPAGTLALYYVVKPCGNGAHAFSRTNEQFQRDVAAYNAKREELGRDPSRC